MAKLRLRCPSCGKRLKADPIVAGAKVRCPNCRTVFRLPEPEEALPHPSTSTPSWSFGNTLLCSVLFGFLGAMGGAWAGVLVIRFAMAEPYSTHAQATGGTGVGLVLLAAPVLFVLGGLVGAVLGFILGILRASVSVEHTALRRAWLALALFAGLILVFWAPAFRLIGRTMPAQAPPPGNRVIAAPAPAKMAHKQEPRKVEQHENIYLTIAPDGTFQFAYQNWSWEGGSKTTSKPVGEAGPLYSSTDGISATVTWPRQRVFEVIVDFDSKSAGRALKVEVDPRRLTKAVATLDEKPSSLPALLPPGKHRLVIQGRCP